MHVFAQGGGDYKVNKYLSILIFFLCYSCVYIYLSVFLSIYNLTQYFGDTERIHKKSFSKSTDNEMLQIFSFLNYYMERF